MNKKAFYLWNGLPIALFIFAGNMLFVGKGSFFELLLSAIVGAVALPIASVAATSVFGKENKKGARKIFFILLSFLASVTAIYVAALTVQEISGFVRNVMLLRLPTLVPSALFVALCSYLVATEESTLRKISFVSAVIVFASVIILLLLSSRGFKTERVEDIIKSAGEISAEGIINNFSVIFAPATIAVIYISAKCREGGGTRGSLLGTIMASLLLFACFFNVFLLLGGTLANAESYPYATAVSTVTAGKLFARMEGVAYIMYYVASVVRVSVCIALVSLLSERISGKKWRPLPYLAGGSVLLVTLILSYA